MNDVSERDIVMAFSPMGISVCALCCHLNSIIFHTSCLFHLGLLYKCSHQIIFDLLNIFNKSLQFDIMCDHNIRTCN